MGTKHLRHAFVEGARPAFFQDTRRRVDEGRWERVGGTWVEMDSNVPCGGSLVRQLLQGNRCFQRVCRRRSPVVYQPTQSKAPSSQLRERR